MGVNRNQSPAEAATSAPLGLGAAIYEFRPSGGQDKVAAGIHEFMGSGDLAVERQREFMAEFWGKFGLSVPAAAVPSTELDHTVDEMRANSRLIDFPLLPSLKDYEDLAKTARLVLPQNGFNPRYRPLVVEDSEGLFPQFVADPEATVAGDDGKKYVLLYTTPAGEIVSWSEYVAWLEAHGHAAVGKDGLLWGSLGRDMARGGPAGLAIALNFLQHANGTPPRENGMAETNAAIYALDTEGVVDARPIRSVETYWHDRKGQFRVISTESLYGSPLVRQTDPNCSRFIGQTLTGRRSTG